MAARRHKAIGSTGAFVYALRSIEAKAELEIEHPEDRLFIPESYVSLFEMKGWRIERIAPARG